MSEADRPKRVLFASAMASSKSSTFTTCSSGPNSSTSGRSRICVTSMIAGERKGRSSRRRCMWRIGLPPLDKRWRKLSVNWSAVRLSITGPMKGAGSSNGAPTTIRSLSRVIVSIASS